MIDFNNMAREQIGHFLCDVRGTMNAFRFDGELPDSWVVWVSDNGKGVAVVDTDDRELMMLYVLPEARGTGTGRELIGALIKEYRNIYGTCTCTSKPFYEAIGCSVRSSSGLFYSRNNPPA